MKVNLFSPILLLLVSVLFFKASILFGRIQEQTSYSSSTSTSSILVHTAYANSSSQGKRPNTKELPHDIGAKIITSPTHPPQDSPVNAAPKVESSSGSFSKSEVDLLKELSKRRDKIENDKKDMAMREQVIKATESKLDQKVVELKDLQHHLEGLMSQYEKKENSKILSLVKIYETMKPKDAAKIFNELEMPVLLQVVSNMKEVKVAPIIASMTPTKARDLSTELAKPKSIQ